MPAEFCLAWCLVSWEPTDKNYWEKTKNENRTKGAQVTPTVIIVFKTLLLFKVQFNCFSFISFNLAHLNWRSITFSSPEIYTFIICFFIWPPRILPFLFYTVISLFMHEKQNNKPCFGTPERDSCRSWYDCVFFLHHKADLRAGRADGKHLSGRGMLSGSACCLSPGSWPESRPLLCINSSWLAAMMPHLVGDSERS